MGGHNHMFAFFPERGSMMEDWPAVDRGQWRRVQVGRYLIDYRGVRESDMAFDSNGRLTDFGINRAELQTILNSGLPFRTSGCPGNEADDVSACNRPYGDSLPSDILSFPFPPQGHDIATILLQMEGKNVQAGLEPEP